MLRKWALAGALLVGAAGCAVQPRVVTIESAFKNAQALDIVQPGSFVQLKGDKHFGYFQKLVDIAGVPVFLAPPNEDREQLWGQTVFRAGEAQFVWINDSLTPDTQVIVLAHELGHVMQPEGLTPTGAEYFAMTVAWLFAEHIHLNTGNSMFHWLALDPEAYLAFIDLHQKEIEDAFQQLVIGTK